MLLKQKRVEASTGLLCSAERHRRVQLSPVELREFAFETLDLPGELFVGHRVETAAGYLGNLGSNRSQLGFEPIAFITIGCVLVSRSCRRELAEQFVIHHRPNVAF